MWQKKNVINHKNYFYSAWLKKKPITCNYETINEKSCSCVSFTHNMWLTLPHYGDIIWLSFHMASYPILMSVISIKPVVFLFHLLRVLLAERQIVFYIVYADFMIYCQYDLTDYRTLAGEQTCTHSWPKSMWDIHTLFFQGILYWDELHTTTALWTCRKKDEWEKKCVKERDCVCLISTVADYMHILHSHEQIIRFLWPSKSSIFSSERKSTVPGHDPFTLSLAHGHKTLEWT